MEKIKKAYTDIFKVCDKYAKEEYLTDFEFEDVRNMRDKAKNHLLIIDWYEKYGLDIKHDRQLFGYNFVKMDDYTSFSYFEDAKKEKEEGYGRYISWSDDDRQPKNEWLFVINFSTGAYIFGDDYPTELFQEFWQELKSYKPKYCDTTNGGLYFSIDSAKNIFEDFPEILKKYHEKNREDAKLRKIKKMKKELKELESITPH